MISQKFEENKFEFHFGPWGQKSAWGSVDIFHVNECGIVGQHLNFDLGVRMGIAMNRNHLMTRHNFLKLMSLFLFLFLPPKSNPYHFIIDISAVA